MEDQNGVKHKVSPQTRFILEDENRSKEYFDYFCDLAPTLNERFIAAERKGEALWLTSFKTYVAALAFILSICALISALPRPWSTLRQCSRRGRSRVLEIGERLTIGVDHLEAARQALDGPGRGEASHRPSFIAS